MYPVLRKESLSEDYFILSVRAEHLQRAQAGQFALLQHTELSEPIPLSILEVNGEEVSFLVKVVGRSTLELKEEAQQISYIAGPLGIPFPVKNYGKVACFGVGWGIAPLYNVAKFLKTEGNSLELYFLSEDGFLPLRERLDAIFDRVEVIKEPKRVDADLIISAGGNRLSRDVLKLNPERPHIAMVNTHMLDAVGLCLVCRVLVDGAVKLACSDGPWFDAHKVDWENLISREDLFAEQERLALEEYQKILRRKNLRKTSSEV
jgi:2-polyprenylphenol hydroxylase and related flavodoxin oxidoreductases